MSAFIVIALIKRLAAVINLWELRLNCAVREQSVALQIYNAG